MGGNNKLFVLAVSSLGKGRDWVNQGEDPDRVKMF
jgi:hypothetical protein